MENATGLATDLEVILGRAVAGNLTRRLRQPPSESMGKDLLDRLEEFDDAGALALLDVLENSPSVSGDLPYESKDE